MTAVEELDPFRVRRRRVLAGLSLVAFIVGGAGVYAANRAKQARQAQVAALKGTVAVQLPQFQLRDQNDTAFTDQSLRGHAWVANFIFTSCTQTCPKLTARMKEVQRTLAADPVGNMVKLVSFTVDPENDTPSVLKAYAEKNGADPARWFFVTGDVEAVKRTVTGGFKMTAERVNKGANEYDILHGNWFAYGDKTGSIHGFSQVENEQDIADVARDLIALERGETTASR